MNIQEFPDFELFDHTGTRRDPSGQRRAACLSARSPGTVWLCQLVEPPGSGPQRP